jgi:hypothetical protein
VNARPHHGTVQQQLDALDRLARETADHVKGLEAALIVMGILPEPRGARAMSETVSQAIAAGLWPPEGYPPPRRHGLRLVKRGAR